MNKLRQSPHGFIYKYDFWRTLKSSVEALDKIETINLSHMPKLINGTNYLIT